MGLFVVGHQEAGDGATAPTVLQNRTLGHVDQLAHVPGPRRLQQLRSLLRGHLRRVTAVFLGELFAQTREQGQDVLTAVTQRRQGDLHRRQTEEQIGAQHILTGFALLLQVRHGNDPRFGRRALFVDEGQQPRLQRLRQGLNILKTQGPAPRLFDQGQFIRVIRRTEQTLGQFFLAIGGAGHGDELFAGARTDGVQGMRDQRLARAGFPVDQHVVVRLTKVEDVLAQPLHFIRRADEFLHDDRAIRQFTAQRAVVQRQAAVLRRALGQFGHPVGVERLFKEIERADAHRLDRHRHIAVAGDHDDRQAAVEAHQALQEHHPVHAGHADVGHDHAGEFGVYGFQRILGRGIGLGLEPAQGQPLADRLTHVFFVVYNRNSDAPTHVAVSLFLFCCLLPTFEDGQLYLKHRAARAPVARLETTAKVVDDPRGNSKPQTDPVPW